MSLESDESDVEHLPKFTFLKQQPPAVKSSSRCQPPSKERVVVICSSDSEESSPPSPGLEKFPGNQDSDRVSACKDAIARLSSENEEEEEIIPLSERLRGKLVNSKSSKISILLSEDQQLSSCDAVCKARGTVIRQNYEQVVTDCREQLLPKASDTQTRTPVSSWEISASDQDDATEDSKRVPLHQPPVCLSVSPAQSSRSLVAEASSEMSPPQKKSKHSQEERERARQAALQRRREREVQKGQREQDRERKKALANMLKAQRPEECLKHITVVLDPVLLQVEGGGQVLSALQSMNCGCVIESQAVPCSITWRRRRAGSSQVEEGSWLEEPNILVLLRLEDFVSMIYSYRQEVQGGTEGPKETLRSFVACVMERAPGKTLALAVVELEKYFRSHKVQSRKKLRQAVLNGSQVEGQGKRKKRKGKGDSGPELSRVEVEEALVDLQLHTGVQVRLLESWKELGDFASMFTKAVAEAPFKKEREKTGFSFYLESEWCRGVKVDRSGKGLSQVWKRQIQQFNRVSLEMASAIVAAYPSPLLLDQAYRRCLSEREQQNMLADIPVRRGNGVTATSRRIGPELSKRIYLQMTSRHPDLSLDVTG
ncbi:crossover junction endonuclease EME1 isoform X1 [Trachemys scripta elegans]|uniref:crossover junction endonuclease EME1 isoform X1 n=1 Tax=Trachemys scripta elegans TaxID=31138 RepID=UPI001557B6C2|nr:crossover junction endonuclease EME1 isoform X1 [Trachemys scripta elegans]XP_034645146.1 crossover junction endonuclease EME1 isoform X1 [Trachemys scripta elegans]XP_034645147.1 crossover junction endonuclease EME1 isoform X1 [Trachemys scripta elegans]